MYARSSIDLLALFRSCAVVGKLLLHLVGKNANWKNEKALIETHWDRNHRTLSVEEES